MQEWPQRNVFRRSSTVLPFALRKGGVSVLPSTVSDGHASGATTAAKAGARPDGGRSKGPRVPERAQVRTLFGPRVSG